MLEARRHLARSLPVQRRLWLLAGLLAAEAALGAVAAGVLSPAWVAILAPLGLALSLGILLDPRLGVFLMVFFAPLDKFHVYLQAPVSFTLKFIFIFFALSLAGWVLAQALKQRRADLRLRVLDWLMALLALVFILASIASAAPKEAFQTALQRILLIGMLYVPLAILRSVEDVWRAVKLFLLTSLLSAVYGLTQFLGFYRGFSTVIPLLDRLPRAPGYNIDIGLTASQLYPQINGFVNNQNMFAMFMASGGAIAGALFIWSLARGEPRARLGLGLATVLMLGALALTASRSGYLAMAAAALVLAFFFRSQLQRPRYALGILLALGLIATGVVLSPMRDVIPTRLLLSGTASAEEEQLSKESEQSLLSHGDAAQMALEVIEKYPFLGTGPGLFPRVAKEMFAISEERFLTHSGVLSIATDAGLVGLALFSLIALVVLRRLWKAIALTPESQTRAILVGMMAAFASFLVFNLPYDNYNSEYIWVLTGLMLAGANAVRRGEDT